MCVYQMESERKSKLPLFVGFAIGLYFWKRHKDNDDKEQDEDSSKRKWVLLVFLGVLMYSFQERFVEITRNVGPLLASNLLLKSGMGYTAASVAAIFVYVGSNTAATG